MRRRRRNGQRGAIERHRAAAVHIRESISQAAIQRPPVLARREADPAADFQRDIDRVEHVPQIHGRPVLALRQVHLLVHREVEPESAEDVGAALRVGAEVVSRQHREAQVVELEVGAIHGAPVGIAVRRVGAAPQVHGFDANAEPLVQAEIEDAADRELRSGVDAALPIDLERGDIEATDDTHSLRHRARGGRACEPNCRHHREHAKS